MADAFISKVSDERPRVLLVRVLLVGGMWRGLVVLRSYDRGMVSTHLFIDTISVVHCGE